MPAGTSTSTTEFLWLRPSGIRDQERSVIGHKLLLQLHGAVSVNIFCVKCDQRLCDRLSDSIHLGCVSTTLHTKTNVNRGESLLAGNKDRLVDLEAQDLRLEERDGRAVDVDEAATLLRVGDSSRSLL